ncbi:hypothetical protein RND81_11G216100 [Saponaria officinalis]|uniref:Protein kinase domain-containing protein n=1 Tax=Saponaria officinalis TaxID=3572 RepID=A0AAW1HP49_SAPOF
MMCKPPNFSTTILTLSIIFLSNYHYSSLALNSDGVALLSFKLSILDDTLHVLDSWTSFDSTPCFWRGVTCGPTYSNLDSDSGRVTGVSLPGCQLLGTIPTNIGFLDRLQTLILSSNMINGSIPDTLFNISTLRVVDVSGNFISGELSESVGRLKNLSVLNVSDNALGGKIPQNLGNLPNLTVISLRNNFFTGRLPSGFGRVRVMDMSSNLLNGSLPVRFGGVDIQLLNVSYNSLTGDIPKNFGLIFPENMTIDLSYNNFTGEIPNSNIFRNQKKDSFVGNVNLCGPPLSGPCVTPSSTSGLPPTSGQPIPSPAIAAFPKTFPSSPDGDPNQETGQGGKNHRIRPQTIVWIVVGDAGGLAILCLVLIYIYRKKTVKRTFTITTTIKHSSSNPRRHEIHLSSSSRSSSDSRGIARWSCLQKAQVEEEDVDEDDKESVSSEHNRQEKGQLVTVDRESPPLELETVLKASAYVLGSGGSNIMYKAVLEDGTVLAVRRVGEGGRMKEFEGHVRGVAKVVHPNLVRVRGFYWAVDEKLVIYEYVPGGSLANARYRKPGSSPCHISWEVRLKIAKGVARGLSHIHEKKHVHGNLKSSNILLGLDMEPKIADFGFDKLSMGKSSIIPGGSTRHFGSNRSMGSKDSYPSPSTSSIGCVSPYHPPESLRSLKPNSKWDVYSFGVLLLELVTGKVIVSDELGPPVLAGLAVGLDDKARVLRMADPAIRVDLEGKEEDLLSCLKLGYNCVSHVPQKRPSMKEVVHVLEKISTSYTD